MLTPSRGPGPARDLVLHIGSSKTGSKSVQWFLRRNRRRLAKLGYLYPQAPGAARHIRLGLLIKSDADLEASILWQRERERRNGVEPAAFREEFRLELLREVDESGLSRVLLSDESLYNQPNESALRRLRRLTGEVATRLRLLVYLRRQDDHLISRYQQSVRTRAEVRRLDEFACQDRVMPYDYYARLRAWERLLQPDEFIVRRFEREGFVGGSLVADFLDAADVDVRAEDLEQIPRRNESLDAESVEFLRLFNLYRIECEGATLDFTDNQEAVARLIEASSGPLLTLPGRFLDDFMAQWEHSNRAVAQHYLGDASGELFRMPRRTDHTTTKQHLDPARLDHYVTLLELPERMRQPLRRLVEREARATDAPLWRAVT